MHLSLISVYCCSCSRTLRGSCSHDELILFTALNRAWLDPSAVLKEKER